MFRDHRTVVLTKTNIITQANTGKIEYCTHLLESCQKMTESNLRSWWIWCSDNEIHNESISRIWKMESSTSPQNIKSDIRICNTTDSNPMMITAANEPAQKLCESTLPTETAHWMSHRFQTRHFVKTSFERRHPKDQYTPPYHICAICIEHCPTRLLPTWIIDASRTCENEVHLNMSINQTIQSLEFSGQISLHFFAISYQNSDRTL